ncbi:AAA domain-containing protein 5 [Elsinoe australis]|uniref:AAA domain-containing protein 5 n=1 Tax=Elsinoe australis TaxID=40998 RepID=A0A4U7B3I4_9PEZI|nr:AAA domain-containing protein 5 [Elsinoe australis]
MVLDLDRLQDVADQADIDRWFRRRFPILPHRPRRKRQGDLPDITFDSKDDYLHAVAPHTDFESENEDHHVCVVAAGAAMYLFKVPGSDDRSFIILIDLSGQKASDLTIANGEVLTVKIQELMPGFGDRMTGTVNTDYPFTPPNMIAVDCTTGRARVHVEYTPHIVHENQDRESDDTTRTGTLTTVTGPATMSQPPQPVTRALETYNFETKRIVKGNRPRAPRVPVQIGPRFREEMQWERVNPDELANVRRLGESFTLREHTEYLLYGKKFVGNASVRLTDERLSKRALHEIVMKFWTSRVEYEQGSLNNQGFVLQKTLCSDPDDLPTTYPLAGLPSEEIDRVIGACNTEEQRSLFTNLKSGIRGNEVFISGPPNAGKTATLALVASLYARFDLHADDRVRRRPYGPRKPISLRNSLLGAPNIPYDVAEKFKQPGFDLEVMARNNVSGIALCATDEACDRLQAQLLVALTAIKPYAIVARVIDKAVDKINFYQDADKAAGHQTESTITAVNSEVFANAASQLSELAKKYMAKYRENTQPREIAGRMVHDRRIKPALFPFTLHMLMLIALGIPLSASIEALPAVQMLRRSPLCHNQKQWADLRIYYQMMSERDRGGMRDFRDFSDCDVGDDLRRLELSELDVREDLRMLREHCVRCADVVVMTFNSAMDAPHDMSMDPTFALIDDAEMADEIDLRVVDALYPSVKTIYLAGDHRQLGLRYPNSGSLEPHKPQMVLPGYLRGILGSARVHQMTGVFHANQEIIGPYSDLFYKSSLRSVEFPGDAAHSEKFCEVASGLFDSHPGPTKNLIMVSTKGTHESLVECDGSRYNTDSACVVQWCLTTLLKHYDPEQIAVTCPYRAQQSVLRTRCAELERTQPSTNAYLVPVKTIDGCLNGMSDVVILDMTATSSPDFLNDQRRLATALSRARYGLIIVCETDELMAVADDNGCKHLSRTLRVYSDAQRATQVEIGDSEITILKNDALSAEDQ